MWMSEESPVQSVGSNPTPDEVVGACDLNTLNRLKETHKSGFLLLVSQEGCAECDEMKKVLEETVKDKKPIVEAPFEDADCKTLAEQLDVKVSPTVFYYEEGKEPVKIEPDGKRTWDDVRKQLRELVAVPAAPT